MIKAFVGAGGKTTLIHRLAEKYRAEGKRVFVTTSTHMYRENNTLVTDSAAEIIKELEEKGYAMAGTQSLKHTDKITALSQQTYLEVCSKADVVLVEADGSRGMPIKFPNKTEPVIYENTDEIVVVCGLSAIGKTAKKAAFRLEEVKACLNIEEDTLITAQHIQKLLREGYINPLKEKYPHKKITLHPVAENSLYSRAVASLIKNDADTGLIRQEWFGSRPKLVIFGAGHVAQQLEKIASCLDLHVKIIDDRAEFANRQRFPFAEEIVCDSFDNVENHLEENAFNVVVTRGHKADFECVKKILETNYSYIGMIGSKLKVAKTLESLEAAGFAEEKLADIHAPIGLKIGAQTPGEIAVSIAAEIIQHKSGMPHSTASGSLLGVKEKGVLCVIINKSGSSPRDVGSMMFVGESTIVDTIGGGTIELAAIKDAKSCSKIMIKEYDLSNAESAKLGMICGGTNTVLFIPVEGA